MNLAKNLINAQGNPMEKAARKSGINPLYMDTDEGRATYGYDWGNTVPTDEQMATVDELQNRFTEQQDISNGVSLPQLGRLAAGAASEHPFKTAGLLGLGAGNLGGLTDNNKFGGQIGGLALGGLGSYLAEDALGPYGKLMLTLGGGQLGALFDKLRAKREQQGYYGGK